MVEELHMFDMLHLKVILNWMNSCLNQKSEKTSLDCAHVLFSPNTGPDASLHTCVYKGCIQKEVKL